MSQSIASQDTTAAETIPVSRGRGPDSALRLNACLSSTRPAMLIAGSPNKKEKRAASARCQPSQSDAVSVLPERDTPGINART